MNGTDSLKDTPSEAMQEAIKGNSEIEEVTRIHAAKSLNRGLKMEDAEAARFGKLYDGTEDTGGDGDPSNKDDEPMDIIATGRATVNVNSPPPKPETATPPTNPPANSLTKAVLAAALVGMGGAGVVLGFAAAELMTKPEPPPMTAPVDTDTRTKVTLS